MHRECVYKLWVSINRPDLSYSHFPVVTLIEALGHFTISKIHTKSLISPFERSHTVQHNFYTNLYKNIFRTYAWRMCVQIMGKYQQARFGLWTFSHCDTDISPTTLSHRKMATYTENLEILKDSSSAAQFSLKSG